MGRRDRQGKRTTVTAYEEIFRSSVDDREGFWLRAADGIDWDVAPTRALDASNPPFYR